MKSKSTKIFTENHDLRRYLTTLYPPKDGRYKEKVELQAFDDSMVGNFLDEVDKVRYVYLKEKSHADTWVNGGKIPLSVATSYKKNVRDGIYTPDEGFIYDSPIPLEEIEKDYVKFEGDIHDFTWSGNTFNGVATPNYENVSRYCEDGLIICFSREFSNEIGVRFKDKVACVKILDIHKLFQIIDDQFPVDGKLADCEYTDDHQRNHFLKSKQDDWMRETRMFWRNIEIKEVEIPPGLAEFAGEIR